MKFTVSGSSRETGGRMSLDLEADSKAAAERKAAAAGMLVHRVQQHGTEPSDVKQRRTRYRSGSGRKVLLVLMMAAAAAGVWYYCTHFFHH